MKRRPNESDLAWNLVDDHRDVLTQAERDMAFVNLGVGEFTTVIRDVLGAVQRARQPLSAETTANVEAWIDCYAQHAEFRALLDGVSGVLDGTASDA
ncbi:hypothetical protein [Mycolicibacterium mengxianglii]|uniref:hypothetical protein n=1 Tax=Mycolicibacterium mengxianglii TaxID=2736649 RepID=UPI0018D03EC6|nr:hypothetical protein [Mycolicibacterium mengxianglii]